jgi:hypothetical protein
MNIQLVVDGIVKFNKQATLNERQLGRVIERVAQATKTTEEIVAEAHAAAVAQLATLTEAQLAERNRIADLTPDQRQKEQLVKQLVQLATQKLRAEAQLAAVTSKIED